MLEEAHRKGFRTYCLSEHVPRLKASHLYPEEVEADLSPDTLHQRFEDYLVEAQKCATAWKGKMNVLVGAELENIDKGCIGYLQDVLDGKAHAEGRMKEAIDGSMAGKGRVDFLVGSLHHVDPIPIDFDKDTFERALDSFRSGREDQQEKIEEPTLRRRAHLRLILRYLDQQYELIRHFRPEVIGHFDLCRLFEPDTPMTIAASREEVDSVCASLLQQVDRAVHRNVDFICSYGGLFEVNSASLRKGWSTPYPGEDVLDVVLAKGGRLCLSDDAHSHEQVGLNYQKAKHYLERKGVSEIWTLRRDDSFPISEHSTRFPRGTVSIRVSDWSTDPFWHTNTLAL